LLLLFRNNTKLKPNITTRKTQGITTEQDAQQEPYLPFSLRDPVVWEQVGQSNHFQTKSLISHIFIAVTPDIL
jgi:hypothetical protein